jgi:N6-adenosine-specific RNA methylase IME4
MNRFNTTNKYEIIYADPSWAYEAETFDSIKDFRISKVTGKCNVTTNTFGAKTHYLTMSMELLKLLPVVELAAENCLLFMWVVSPLLEQCISVGVAWGFKYVTVGFVWCKHRSIPGYYTMSQCELCLIFKKGKIPKPRGARNIQQFFYTPQRIGNGQAGHNEHSLKPTEIRQRIDEMFPTQKGIELFAREKVEGWDCWGNEVESDIQLV